jgi:putative tryptophan/tyrosine transport system substrate-binding protein
MCKKPEGGDLKNTKNIFRIFIWSALIGSLFLLTACKVNKSEEKQQQPAASNSSNRVYKITIAYFGPDPGADLTMKGLMDGLSENGFTEGKNLEVKKTHANGEIAGIPMMLQSVDGQGMDMIVAMTTPVLTASCNSVKKTPVVFMYVYDPIAAGAGKSMTDHLPNITGVGSFPPIEDTIDTIQKLVPNVKAIGTLYNSSEANSRKVIEVGREICKKRGIKLEEVTVTGTSEVYQAAQVVASRNVQALWVTGDNTALMAFDGIGKVALSSRLPLVINDPEFVQKGAVAAVGIGWYKSGHATAKSAAMVLKGENPKNIPFENVAQQQLVLNFDVAKQLGISFPESMVQEAKKDQ